MSSSPLIPTSPSPSTFPSPCHVLSPSDLSWLSSTFSLSSPTPSQLLTLAHQQYTRQRYHITIRLLECAITITTQIQNKKHGTAAGAGGAGGTTNATEMIPALFLLGNAHQKLSSLPPARECYLACIRLGYDPAWQPLITCEHTLWIQEQTMRSLQQQQVFTQMMKLEKLRKEGGGEEEEGQGEGEEGEEEIQTHHIKDNAAAVDIAA